jgi:hypothetical protein
MNHSLKSGDNMNNGSDCVDKPYSEIRDYVGQLERQTDRMNTIMQNLRTRLESVLIPVTPTPGDSKPGLAAVGPSTQLGQELINILHANDNTAAQLNDLIDRLHV